MCSARMGRCGARPCKLARAAALSAVRLCLTCLRQRDADLEALIAGSARIDAVVMSKDSAVVPW